MLQVSRIQASIQAVDAGDNEDNGLDFGLEPLYSSDDEVDCETLNTICQPKLQVLDKEYHILNVTNKTILKNGFRYIKELVMQLSHFTMYKTVAKLEEHGIDVFSIKTDAITIHKQHLEQAQQLLDLGKDIGKLRHSKSGIQIILPSKPLELTKNELVKIPKYNTQHIEIQDEYDTETICRIYEDKRRVLMLGDLPGVGKSYACKQMENLGYNVLFVCPTNELCINNSQAGIFSVTVNRFFDVGPHDEFRNIHENKFNDSPYQVVVFDEIFLLDINMLTKIKHYIEKRPK